MSTGPVDILGGESVYCINRRQLDTALQLAERDPQTSPRIQAAIRSLESTLSRTELAALAFVLIERLRKNSSAG
ncbi:MAG TPA: hypothetical protein EYP56_16600 [Planctomycetaceae bacterium]|nr:hypothetical protein [Planctomycetaceae bacterium]HIQ22444.1 hypothetical protein [Planctomycetota bacterium]